MTPAVEVVVVVVVVVMVVVMMRAEVVMRWVLELALRQLLVAQFAVAPVV